MIRRGSGDGMRQQRMRRQQTEKGKSLKERKEDQSLQLVDSKMTDETKGKSEGMG